MAVAVGLVLTACGQGPPPHAQATESVWCADRDGVVDVATWPGHDGTLSGIDVQVVALADGDVDHDELVAACTAPLPRRAAATLCEAYATPEAVRRLAGDVHVTAVHGEPGDDRPGFPVVVVGDVACEALTLEVGQTIVGEPDLVGGLAADQLRAWDSTAAFNRWRQVERSLVEAAKECLDVDAARRLALDARDLLPGDWPVLESAHGAGDAAHAGLCLEVRMDRAGTLRVDYSPGPVAPVG